MVGVHAVAAEPERARAVLRQRLDLNDAEEIEEFEILAEAAEFWRERHLPFWVLVA